MNFDELAQSNIINTLKLQDASEEVKREAIDDATEVIFESVVDRVKAGLSNEALAEYEHLSRENIPEEDRVQFLKKHIPNFEEIVAEETLRYKYLTEIMVSAVGE